MPRALSIFVFFAMLIALYVVAEPFFRASQPITDSRPTLVDCPAKVHLTSLNPQIKCISLLDDDLLFPRNVVSIKTDVWLVDKGTDLFTSGHQDGVLYRYQKTSTGYVRDTILEDLLDPNDLDYRIDHQGRDWVYVSTAKQVFRIRADLSSIAQTVASREDLINDIPTHGWHKLTAILLSQQSLWLTVPSASDHCELPEQRDQAHYPCDESDTLHANKATALIRRYDFDANDQLKPGFTVVARGLRDALGVAINPLSKAKKPQLIAADNGWDQIDLNAIGLDWRDSPADEINVIDTTDDSATGEPMPHFRWPYCYGNNQITPPYQDNVDSCAQYHVPQRLLTAHTAPLSVLYHGNRLLVNLHGPRPEAGRTVSYALDEQGLPVGEPKDLIDWAYIDNDGIRGRPLGLAAGEQGELYITDDWGQRLMRVTFK